MEEKNIYQVAVDSLCAKHSIPTIPVRIAQKGSLSANWAYFDGIEYFIEVEPDCPKKYLIHEWTHYCIALVGNVGSLEESLCDLVPIGVLANVDDEEDDYLTKALAELPTGDEDEEVVVVTPLLGETTHDWLDTK